MTENGYLKDINKLIAKIFKNPKFKYLKFLKIDYTIVFLKTILNIFDFN